MKTNKTKYIAAIVFTIFSAGFSLPASAAWFAKFEGIDGEAQHVEHALLDIQAQTPRAIGLLLPAVQKVREAAARAQDRCSDATGRVDGDCSALFLKTALIESRRERGVIGLWDLAALGLNMSPRELQSWLDNVGRRGTSGVQQTEDMLVALFVGLHIVIDRAHLAGPDTTGVLAELIDSLDGITPETALPLVRHCRRGHRQGR